MSAAFASVDEYLRKGLEPDAEYVDGVIEERFLGTERHSAWMDAVSSFFWARSEAWHIRAAETHYRIADVAGFDEDARMEPIPTVPPLLVIEVLSPEKGLGTVLRRLPDFEAMGVSGLYVVDPLDGTLLRFREGKLGAAGSILLRGREIRWAEITESPC